MSGSAPVSILFILPIDKACILCDMLMSRTIGDTRPDNLDEMEMSAMMELGNILAATYLNALSMFTNIQFIPSVPALGIDMAGD